MDATGSVNRRTLLRSAGMAAAGAAGGPLLAAHGTGRKPRRKESGEMFVYEGGPFPVTYAVYGTGEPVLMITGMASVLDWFHFNIPFFVDAGYQVIAQDLRGANRPGIPAAPGPYSTRDMAQDSLGILDEVGVRRAHVVGLSMGGMMAQHLAISHRERCRSVSIVANGLVKVPDDAGATARQAAAAKPDPEKRAGDEVDEDLEAVLTATFTPEFKETQPERYDFFVDMYRDHRARPETLSAQIDAAMGHDTSDDLFRITDKVQLIVGELDTINAEHVGEVAERIRHSELHLLPGMAHGLNLEHADEYNDLVLDFLQRQSRRR